MQNSTQKFRQSSIAFEKPRIFSEKLKPLTSSNHHRVSYFLPKFCTSFLFTTVYERVLVILFRSWVICENEKRPGLSITQNLRKIKKSQTPCCRHWQIGNVCKISAKNIKLFGSWSSGKFQIFQTNNLVSLI